MIASKDHI